MEYLLGVAIGYLLGSIPTGYLIGKWKGIDIREHGSGNIGATNVWRVLGKKYGIPTLIMDALKGFLPLWILETFFISPMPLSVAIPAILGALLGHMYPIWIRGRGGKGVATGLGALLYIIPYAVVVGVVVFLVTVFFSKYVSLGSMLGAISVVFAYVFFYGLGGENTLFFWFLVFIALYIIYRHKANIKRIIKGEESRISEYIHK